MKPLLTLLIIISLFSCKKNKTKPNEPMSSVICVPYTTGIAVGKYCSTVQNHPDTIVVSFIKTNCPNPTFEYQIIGLDKAFNSYGSPLIHDGVYGININDSEKYGESSELKVKVGDTGIMISGMSTYYNPTAFTSYISFKKILQ